MKDLVLWYLWLQTFTPLEILFGACVGVLVMHAALLWFLSRVL